METKRDKQEIRQCVKSIKKRLKEDGMNSPENSAVKAGYQKAITILKSRSTTHVGMGIENLDTIQARAIAMLAIDYVKGEIDEKILLSVRIK